jgi:FkbM family methyltransferase
MATNPNPSPAPYAKSQRVDRAGVSVLRLAFQSTRGKCRYLVAHPGFRQARVLTLCRLLRWRVQCALGIPATVRLPQWDVRFHVPPRWHGAGTTMIYALRGQYEKELLHLDRFISPGMVVVDGGANCGIYTVVAAKLVGPSGLVLSFEPGAEAFEVLRKNVDLNGLAHVRTYRAALSDREGEAVLYQHKEGPNSYSLGATDTAGMAFEEIVTRTLSQVLHEETVRQVGLIKLDVEGYEELVLRGAMSVMARYHPTVLLEMNGTAAGRLGLSPVGSWKLLEGLGYGFCSLTERGELNELSQLPDGKNPINVVAIHRARRK